MCLAMPAKITEMLDDDMAMVEVGGVAKEISLGLVEGVDVGDFVIIHVGYAISRLDAAEAEKTLKLFEEMENLNPEAANENESQLA